MLFCFCAGFIICICDVKPARWKIELNWISITFPMFVVCFSVQCADNIVDIIIIIIIEIIFFIIFVVCLCVVSVYFIVSMLCLFSCAGSIIIFCNWECKLINACWIELLLLLSSSSSSSSLYLLFCICLWCSLFVFALYLCFCSDFTIYTSAFETLR